VKVLGVVAFALVIACAASAAPSPGEVTFAAKTARGAVLFGVRSDGSGLRAILRGAGRLAWSGSGTRVVYTGCGGFCVADAYGRNRRPLFRCAGASDAAWSRDGRVAVGCSGRIVSVRFDGKGARTVRTSSGATFSGLAWSPDGRTISGYEVGRKNGKLRAWLEIVRSDGSRVKKLSSLHNVAARRGRTSWSSDGGTLAFQLEPGLFGLFDFRRQVVANIVQGSSATFSPDGQKIAFVGPAGLYVANAGSKNATQVARGGALPRWSPDSRMLAFVGGGRRVGVIGSDGHGGHWITPLYAAVLDLEWRNA
jgi:Tol biopolymer transport system component